MESQMRDFSFYFGLVLSEMILGQTDNLSKALQHKALCASGGQRIAFMTGNTLSSLTSDLSFKTFWEKITVDRVKLDIESPKLPPKSRSMMTHC